MDITRILAELQSERKRLNQAIAALEKVAVRTRRGRKRAAVGQKTVRRRRRLTPEGRRRLSEMMKKRWAEKRRKKAG